MALVSRVEVQKMEARGRLEGGRADGVRRFLGVLAVVLWIAMLVFAYWNQQYVYARADAPLFIPVVLGALMTLAVPFVIGAYVARMRPTSPHPVRTAAVAAALVQVGTLLLGPLLVALLTGPDRVSSLFVVNEYFLITLIGGLIAIVAFGLEAALIGAAGGATNRMLSRRPRARAV